MRQDEFLKRYEFNIRTDKIGGGSFGTVYKAYDTVLDRFVAIKISEVKRVGDKEFSLREEFEAIANLPPHANIAHYEDVFTFESFQGVFDYAVMQYYKEGNLSEFIKNNPDLSYEQRQEIALQFLYGIGHLHKHKVVHRDLKPGNILVVKRQNGQIVPKITDFGLSKQAEDGQGSRFQNSFAGGTIQYSSPEQIKGEPLKLNTDLWSFGVIAYEIFTGKKLFDISGFSSATIEWQNQITQQILKQNIEEKINDFPDSWQLVLRSCLQRDLSKRIQSTDEILKKLDKSEATFVESSATQVTPTTTSTVVQQNEAQSAPTRVSNPRPLAKSTSSSGGNTLKYATIGILGVGALAAGLIFFPFGNKEDKKEIVEEIPIPFTENNLMGYKKGDSIVVVPKFISAGTFNEGKAYVADLDSAYYINEKGQWAGSIKKNKDKEVVQENQKKDDNQNPSTNTSDTKTKTETVTTTKQQEINNTSSPDSPFEKGKKLYDQGNYKDAFPLLLQAAKSNIGDAQHRVGYMHHYGLGGLQQNYSEAKYWYEQGAKNNVAVSMNNLGVMYINGEGVSQNYNLGMDWYVKAANNGSGLAMRNIGNLYEDGKGVEKNYAKAKEWFEKAAAKGDAEAMANLGYFYNYGYGVSVDYTQAKSWYEKGAAAGSSWAMRNLGIMYDYGDGGNYNWKEAANWYQKAADKGDTTAKRLLGEFYLFGVGGLTKNVSYAKQLLQQAADAGDKTAKEHLKVLTDIEKKNYFRPFDSKLGNNLYLTVGELNEEMALYPAVVDAHDNSWVYDVTYSLGQSKSVRIWPNDADVNYEDEIRFTNYTSSPLMTQSVGTHSSGVSIKGGDYGQRTIGYIYYRAYFYSDTQGTNFAEKVVIKIPFAVCWLPRNSY